ncbi:ty3-gypsy retrotransposon protein [Tanacetum coccineum]
MAELEAIRLLLKEQAASQKQQADAFQAQMTALQADLQVTEDMLQVAQHGGGGGGGDHLSLTLPRSMRLDVPKFSGSDPDRWIFSITEYFTLLNTPVDQRLRVVGFNLEGDAAEWFRWMIRNKLITSWEGFLESVQNRFDPCKYEDPQGALSKLLQTGTIAQYQSEFEKLMNRVTDISEGLLISFYVSGLKPSLQRELLVSKPTSLGDAFALARVTEARTDVGAAPLSIKWISPAERQERLSKGLCFNCDNKWVRGHKYPRKFLLLMADEEAESEQIVEIVHDDAMESGDISILDSLVGHGSPRSLQLWGTIGAGKVHILIDNGSTHNFVQPGVVECMQLPISGTKPFKVYIGSGETLLCENMCTQVAIDIQGLRMEVDLYVLPMKGPDLVHELYVKKSKCVFGTDSLEYLGHIISGRGVKVDPKKVSAVSGWPVLTSQRQVRIFLGLAGYYRRFIKNYATVVAPLFNLLQKNGFKWGETEGAAFSVLKGKLTHAPILGLPDFEDTFVIEADAFDVGIGVALLQKEQPLGYFSRKLGPRMKVAATYQKELFAIVEAVYKWRQYLIGRRFIIRTDHRSIKELMQQVIQTPLQQKYVRKHMGFNFGIEYKSGASNLVADALSRLQEDDDEVTSAFMALSRPVVGLLEELKRENETLDELCQLHRRLDQGESLEGFQREQGLLLFQGKYFIGVESKSKALLLSEFHVTPSAAYEGVQKDASWFVSLILLEGNA